MMVACVVEALIFSVEAETLSLSFKSITRIYPFSYASSITYVVPVAPSIFFHSIPSRYCHCGLVTVVSAPSVLDTVKVLPTSASPVIVKAYSFASLICKVAEDAI